MPIASPTFTFPKTFSAAQRVGVKRQYFQLQSLLNNPRARPEAKASASKGLAELRKQFAALGGKIVEAAPAAPTTSPALKFGFSSDRRKDVESADKIAAALTASPPLSIPLVSPRHLGTTTPVAPPVTEAAAAPVATPVPSAEPPVVAERIPESGIIPSLPPQRPAAAASTETPEMQRLRRLIDEPPPAAPSGDLTTGQKIAYGLLAGLRGIETVTPLIEGQHAAAAQKYLAQRNERETQIRNLEQFISLQQQQTAAQGVQLTREREIERDALDREGRLHNRVAAVQGLATRAAAAAISAEAIADDLEGNPDPAIREYASSIGDHIASLNIQRDQLAKLASADPNAFIADDAPVVQYEKSLGDLEETVQQGIGALVSQAKASELPDKDREILASLRVVDPTLDQIERLAVKQGIGGPFASRIMESNIGMGMSRVVTSTVAPEATRLYGLLKTAMSRMNSIMNNLPGQGAGKGFTEIELLMQSGNIFFPNDPAQTTAMKVAYTREWVKFKREAIAGVPFAQDRADKALLRLEIGLAPGEPDPVIGHTEDGFEKWDVNGAEYILAPTGP